MKWTLPIVPASMAAYYLGAKLVPDERAALFHGCCGAVALLWAAVASVRAGAAFERGGPLRLAWMANGISFAACVPVSVAPFLVAGAPLLALRLVAAVAATVTGLLSIWTFGRAYREAGLDFGATRRHQVLTVLAGVAVGAVVCSTALIRSVRGFLGGDFDSITVTIASAGDIFMFGLLVPIFLAVVRLRGGLLAWPWSYLLISSLCWLSSDLAAAYETSWFDAFLVGAAVTTVAAAHAQRQICSLEEGRQ